MIVICVPPDPETCPPVTSIASTVELSDVFLIVIFPLSVSTFSSKLSTIFASTATPVALSAGVDELKVGAVLSTVVKFKAVVLDIPSYELLTLSSKAVESTNT